MKEWYVLQVLTGSECEVRRQLQGQGYHAIVPQSIELIRRGGRWHELPRVLIPGYVFVELCYSNEEHYKLKAVSCVIRLLPKERPTPLSGAEVTWLYRIGQQLLRPSRVDLSGSVPVILEGVLTEFQDALIRIDRHRRRAYLTLPVLGEQKEICLSIAP